jgi:CRP-like cAMP-binding protein
MTHSSRGSNANANPLIRRLQGLARLSPAEHDALCTMHGVSVREFSADHDIVRDGDRASQCCLIISGFACRYKITGEQGKRQILSFHIAGDIPDLMSLHIAKMDHNLSTVAPSRLMFIPHHTVRDLCKAHPNLANVFWRETLIDAGIFREWVTNVGRRDAYARIAHLICEMFQRSQAVGLTEGTTFHWPITQTELGDATGLTTVHVNRTLKELRKDGIVEIQHGGKVVIHNLEKLEEAGEFDPTYLHLLEAA